MVRIPNSDVVQIRFPFIFHQTFDSGGSWLIESISFVIQPHFSRFPPSLFLTLATDKTDGTLRSVPLDQDV